MNIKEQPHKIEGKQILWFNGEKWLVRQTFKTIKKAKDFLKELQNKL